MIGQSIASQRNRPQALQINQFATYDVLPPIIVPSAAWGLAVLELVLAIGLLTATQIRVAAKCLAGLHFVYLIWLLVALLRGLNIPNCGCFGAYFARPLTVLTLVEDLVLLGLSVWFLSRTK